MPGLGKVLGEEKDKDSDGVSECNGSSDGGEQREGEWEFEVGGEESESEGGESDGGGVSVDVKDSRGSAGGWWEAP